MLAWRMTWIEEPGEFIVRGVAELNTTGQLTLLLQNLKNILFNLKNQGKKKRLMGNLPSPRSDGAPTVLNSNLSSVKKSEALYVPLVMVMLRSNFGFSRKIPGIHKMRKHDKRFT